MFQKLCVTEQCKISYRNGKRVVKNIKFISLVNLIMDKEVVKELIQSQLNTENLVDELQKFWKDKNVTKCFRIMNFSEKN